jgi:hypothetical protein
MARPSGLLAGAALFAGLFAATSASAQMDPGVAARLCVNGAVDPDRLAFAIVSEARATAFGATGNPRGDSPDDFTANEARYVIAAINAAPAVADRAYPAGSNSARPFGPDIDLVTDANARAARDRIVETASAFLFDLTDEATPIGKTRFWLVAASPGGELDPLSLWERVPPTVLRCAPVEATAEPTGVAGETAAPARPGWPPNWRIRGTAADLGEQVGALSDVEAASVGYSRDGVAGTETATFTAAVGYRFEDPTGQWAATPFVGYDYKEVAGDADDVGTLSMGALLSIRGADTSVALDYALELAYQIDREKSSEQLKARLYLRPSFDLDDASLFGQRFYDGGFWVFPDLTLIGDLTDIRDPGSNAAFANGGDYQGVGADVSLRVGHLSLKGLSFSLGRRQLWLTGDLAFDEAIRRFAKLEYDFDDSPLGFAVTWSEGRNDDTFKLEDSLEVQLTWRR